MPALKAETTKPVVRVHHIAAGGVRVNCYGLTDTAVGMTDYKLSGYGPTGPGYLDVFLYEKCACINVP
jgi:hypothetical protein